MKKSKFTFIERREKGSFLLMVRSFSVLIFYCLLIIVSAMTSSAATAMNRDIQQPEVRKLTITAGKEWKAVDSSRLVIAPGSALDFDALIEPGPAGKFGRVITGKDGSLVFEKRDQPVRFNGFNTGAADYFCVSAHPRFADTYLLGKTDEETRRNIDSFAAQVRRQGYNLVRFQGIDAFLFGDKLLSGENSGDGLIPSRIDQFDYLVYALKQAGIYISLDASSYNLWVRGEWNEGDKQQLKERFMVDPPSRAVWEKGARMLFTHRNPYTKMTYAEDPVVATVTFCNEHELRSGRYLFSREPVKPFADARWREFLRKRYATEADLRTAWKVKDGDGLTFDTAAFSKELLNKPGECGNDANIFVYELERDMLLWFQKTIKEIGYTGLASNYDVSGQYRYQAIRNENSIIFNHNYHNHASAYTSIGSKMQQNSITGNAAAYWRTSVASRYLNRALCVYEYNAGYWGRYRHEDGLVYPGYSALQGFSGITVHCGPVMQRSVYPMADFVVGRDPILRANQALAALLYLRGDVAPSPHTTGLKLSRDFLFHHGVMNQPLSSEQSKLSLLTRFGLTWPDELPKGMNSYATPDLTLAPAAGGKLVMTDWFAKVAEGAPSANLDSIVETMKAKGMLAADNPSRPSAGLYQSDTGELTLDAGKESMLVRTARTEGAALKAGQEASLKCATHIKSSVPAMIAVSSLNPAESIADASRLLIVYSTDALNTGFEASPDRVELKNNGKLPVLMQTGILELELKTSKAASLKLKALGLDGTPVETLPMKAEGDRLLIRIDTSKLANGATPFFELTEK